MSKSFRVFYGLLSVGLSPTAQVTAGDTRFNRREGTLGGAADDKKPVQSLAQQADEAITGIVALKETEAVVGN